MMLSMGRLTSQCHFERSEKSFIADLSANLRRFLAALEMTQRLEMTLREMAKQCGLAPRSRRRRRASQPGRESSELCLSPRSDEKRRALRVSGAPAPGGLFFGDFLLAAQKKVTRPRRGLPPQSIRRRRRHLPIPPEAKPSRTDRTDTDLSAPNSYSHHRRSAKYPDMPAVRYAPPANHPPG